mgnify:CR=1 FL=1
MKFDEEAPEELKGSDGGAKGGLVVKRKPTSSDKPAGSFKKPSLFGLEVRAKEKREEKRQKEQEERERERHIKDKKVTFKNKKVENYKM